MLHDRSERNAPEGPISGLETALRNLPIDRCCGEINVESGPSPNVEARPESVLAFSQYRELARDIGTLARGYRPQEPLGGSIVMGVAKREPHAAGYCGAEQTRTNLTGNAGADEGPRNRIIFRVMALIENAGGDGVGNHFATENPERGPGLSGYWSIRQVLRLSQSGQQSQQQ
jgi:hypothetical protein